MQDVGLIGVGSMGFPIAERLLDGDLALWVYDIASGPLIALAQKGANQADSVKQVSNQCDIVLLSLPGPAEVTHAVHQLLDAQDTCSIIVDLSTNSITVAKELADVCESKNVSFLDAPVSGGIAGARKGTLSTMIGGEADIINQVRPILDLFCSDVFHVGPSGSGALAKLVNNQIFLAASVMIQEAYVFGEKAGLSTDETTDILSKSSAGLYMRKAGFVLDRSFDKPMFKLGIARKDLELAVQSAADLDFEMPVAAAALEAYRQAGAENLDDENFNATLKVLEQAAGLLKQD